MIKHTKNPFLHLKIKDGNCEVEGTGNTWQYLLLFAYIVKVAKEGRFTNGFDAEGDVNTVSDILEALDRLFEGDYVDGE